MDDLFSLFISLGKHTSERVSLSESLEAIRAFAAAYNIIITNQCLDQNDRIIFDLVGDNKMSVKDCDIRCLTHESESITIFGGNEVALRKTHLLDETNIDCFISRLAVFLFLRGKYEVGLVASEDTFTSLDFTEFHPGYWTVFRSDTLPTFVMGVPCEWADERVKMYRHDQLAQSGRTAAQMGQDIVRMLESTTQNNEIVIE
jgi:hypothetical protein